MRKYEKEFELFNGTFLGFFAKFTTSNLPKWTKARNLYKLFNNPIKVTKIYS